LRACALETPLNRSHSPSNRLPQARRRVRGWQRTAGYEVFPHCITCPSRRAAATHAPGVAHGVGGDLSSASQHALITVLFQPE
jgi:hypothetical protein